MTARHARRGAASRTVYGIDRMVRNVRTGRFVRGLSALTTAGALVTGTDRPGMPADGASRVGNHRWVGRGLRKLAGP